MGEEDEHTLTWPCSSAHSLPSTIFPKDPAVSTYRICWTDMLELAFFDVLVVRVLEEDLVLVEVGNRGPHLICTNIQAGLCPFHASFAGNPCHHDPQVPLFPFCKHRLDAGHQNFWLQ